MSDVLMKTFLVYVTASDISGDPTHYVSGSNGQVKTIKSYRNGAITGEHAYLTTFYYEDTTNPTKATSIIETSTTV